MEREESVAESGPATTSPARLVFRSFAGGVLMGLANLVPGISGGTMLLAAGIYPRFIRAVAEITTLRFRARSLLVLACVGLAAGIAILLLAGTIRDLVVDRRWIMYSLFIGLTLGGVPAVWKLARPATRSTWVGALAGVVAMSALALAQQAGVSSSNPGGSSIWMLGVAGIAGASAMILPGISGGYLLLVLGQYLPVLSAIDRFKIGVESRDPTAMLPPATGVLLPFGIGVAIGVIAVSNLLRWLLARYRNPTLGVLLGLLLGAVIGLWPFQSTVDPVPGETIIQGRLVTQANLAEFAEEDYPTARFRPTPGQVGGSLGLILIGLTATVGVSRLGREES